MYVEQKFNTVGGKQLLLRCVQHSDAAQLRAYMLKISQETDFLLREPQEAAQLTQKQEEAFVERIINAETELMLLGFLEGDFVGCCSLSGLGFARNRHRASIAIALYQRYTGQGIGQLMLKRLIEVAKAQGVEQLELEVVQNNTRAIALYEKLGFTVYGCLPHAVKYKDGRYADDLLMVKVL